MYLVTKKPMVSHIQKKEYHFILKSQAVNFFLELCGDLCYPVEETNEEQLGEILLESGGIGYDYRITLTEI